MIIIQILFPLSCCLYLLTQINSKEVTPSKERLILNHSIIFSDFQGHKYLNTDEKHTHTVNKDVQQLSSHHFL